MSYRFEITQLFIEVDYFPIQLKTITCKANLRFTTQENENILIINSYNLSPNFKLVYKGETYEQKKYRDSKETYATRNIKKDEIIIEGYVEGKDRKELLDKLGELKNNIFNHNYWIEAYINTTQYEVLPEQMTIEFIENFSKYLAKVNIKFKAKNIY